MLRRPVAATALILSAAACSSDPTLPPDQWVRAHATGDATLTILNRGSAPVHVHVSDPTELAILVACSPETCTRVDPGRTVRVAYADIINYDPGDAQAAVNWWVFRDNGLTVTTGSIVADL